MSVCAFRVRLVSVSAKLKISFSDFVTFQLRVGSLWIQVSPRTSLCRGGNVCGSMQSAVALLLSQRSLGLSGDCDRLHDEGVQASQARDDIALFVCAVEITCSFAWIGGKRASLQLTANKQTNRQYGRDRA
jgi:hypothetical protein